MNLTELLKDNPITSVATIITALGVIIGTAFAADERYQKQSEAQSDRSAIQKQLEVNRLTGEATFLRSRKLQLEDRVYDDPTLKRDASKKARTVKELEEVDKELSYKQKRIDDLQGDKK